MKTTIFKIFSTIAVTVAVLAAPAYAASKPNVPSYIGFDISYPQCGKTLPSKPAFGIVGVNGGLANTTNPCLVRQLQWAKTSSGITTQEKIQLYVNTANPGGLNTPSWPTNDTDPYGNQPVNPYGNCDGSNSLACSWKYGWDRAVEAVSQRFMPAAYQAGISSNAASYIWWLDVETINTWQSGEPDSRQKNTADLEGMAAHFQLLGARVGIYSTTAQWDQIAGEQNVNSNLNGLPNWRPGARSLTPAKTNCELPPLTNGGYVVLTQYLTNNLDHNYSCAG